MIYYKDLVNEVVYGYDETEESQLPYIEKAIENGWEDITGSWPPPPEPPTAEDNKAKAYNLLFETDWTTIADVADPINSPYLDNQDEFIAYRNLVRQIAVYPTAGNLVWPVKPNKVWK
jgi:hypothetical protein